MRSEVNNNVLQLFFEGELNSYNSDSIEKEIEGIFAKNQFNKVILDFSKLDYISSAGLRIILKVKQKYDDTQIVEASLEVYDVLSMTGFVNIMSIKKALKRIDITEAEVIGEGFFSTVYRIDGDTIIKVFNRVSDPDQIERELKLAKEAFVLGIPTAISFDIVRVDDKLGVRFEMLDCISLKNAFLKNPDQYDELIDRYVKLLKKINTTESVDPNLPDSREHYLKKVESLKDILDEKHYLKAKMLIEGIPQNNTFVHGDCHFKNIMVQGNDFLLIDMDTLSKGNPIFELAGIRAPYVAFEEDDPGNSEKFLGVPAELSRRIYEDVVSKYCGKDDPVIKDKIALVCYIHMLWWNKVNTPDNKARYEGCSSRLIALLDKYNDLNIA